jgi:hypothetical protein
LRLERKEEEVKKKEETISEQISLQVKNEQTLELPL